MSIENIVCGTSTKDGVDAVDDALNKISENLHSDPPKFISLFTTSHYSADDQQNMLRIIQETCGTKSIIGGTITGFVTANCITTKGIAILAFFGSFEYADICVENGKKNPKKTAEIISSYLSFKKSKTNPINMLFTVMPGPVEPVIMTNNLVASVMSKMSAALPEKIFWIFRDFISVIAFDIFNYGNGNEDLITDALSKRFVDYFFFGFSAFDSIKAIDNRQFYHGKVVRNSIVCASLSFDNEIIIERSLPLIRTNKRIKIKRGWRDYYISQINSNKAVEEYLKVMGWPQSYISQRVEQIFNKTFFHPFRATTLEVDYAFPAGLFVGSSIAVNRKILTDELELNVTSATAILKKIDENIEKINEDKQAFTIFNMGMNVIGIMGRKIEIIQQKCRFLNDKYIIIFGAGEQTKKINERAVFDNFSITMLSFCEKKY